MHLRTQLQGSRRMQVMICDNMSDYQCDRVLYISSATSYIHGFLLRSATHMMIVERL